MDRRRRHAHPRPLPRARAATQAGLRSAFAFPIRCAGKVLGVMEFFAAAPVAPDDELLATMSSLGSQIGQFVERCRAERGVHESEARKTAILNAAFDCIITMDGSREHRRGQRGHRVDLRLHAPRRWSAASSRSS